MVNVRSSFRKEFDLRSPLPPSVPSVLPTVTGAEPYVNPKIFLMAVTRAPRKSTAQRFQMILLHTTDHKHLMLLRGMVKRAAKMYVWTIEKHQSGYLKDEEDLRRYVDLHFHQNTFDWFPKEILFNVMLRARMHYLANPDAKPDFSKGVCLPFSFKDYKIREKGFEFTLLDEVPSLPHSWLGAECSEKQLDEYKNLSTQWLTLSYSTSNRQMVVLYERKRFMGMRVDVTGKMFYGTLEGVTESDLQVMKATSQVISPVRFHCISRIRDFHEANGKYPSWDYTVQELKNIRHQLSGPDVLAYDEGVNAAYYHTAMQALHKFNTEGDAKYWPRNIDRVSMLMDPYRLKERKLPCGKKTSIYLHIPKIGKRSFYSAKGTPITSILETVKLPHVLCLYLNRSFYYQETDRIRFGIYVSDPRRFNSNG